MNPKNISLSATEKISLISNLATMLSAGIPILEAVNSLIEESKGNPKLVLETLREDLIEGKRVYSCLSRFPQTFDKVAVNIIRASEEAGTLDIALQDLKENIKKEIEFGDKVKSAMVYPMFIMVVFVGVMLMILIVVIPKISIVFSRLKVNLPLPTRLMIALSDLMLKNTLYFVGGTALAVLAIVIIYKKEKKFLLNILSSFPLISHLVREIDLTRFTRSLHLLLSSGIPITDALALSGDVVVKRDIARVIARARDMVTSGKRLSEGFRGSKGTIPLIMVKLIEAGEKTGSLDKSMQDVSEYLDYQVSGTLKTLTALLEPIMLVVVGIAVGGMMMAIIAPIYGLIGQIGGR
jgi:type II secretory pathway component PulF